MSIQATKRACDCCRKRKVKCDAPFLENEHLTDSVNHRAHCGPCRRSGIFCTYLQPPQKKGPKGLRSNKIIRSLRARNAEPAQSGAPDSRSTSPSVRCQRTGQLSRAYSDLDAAPRNEMPNREASHQIKCTNLDRHTAPTVTADFDPNETAQANDSPVAREKTKLRLLSGEDFLPYMQLFNAHLFVIMPVVPERFFELSFFTDDMESDEYCFVSALCAATIVQLDESVQQSARIHATKSADQVFIEECLRERQSFDHIEHVSMLGILTSFFLFAHSGNCEKHAKAWHYLQEGITMAENMSLDDEQSYEKLGAIEAQWRRRLYWLLFITERAYAVQRRKQTRLHPSVHLPSVFDSEDPQLFKGFVSLAKLFSAVDDSFISAWRGLRENKTCDQAWLARTQTQLESLGGVDDAGLTETQRLDIEITRQWLHTLTWQLGVRNGLIWGGGNDGMRLDYPVDLAKTVVAITSAASASALDSHGIGMEQKLSDIAGCLADMLRCTGDTPDTFLEGKYLLNLMLQQLSTMRGKESRYLKPLMAKMEGIKGYELGLQLLQPEISAGQSFTMEDSPTFGKSFGEPPPWAMQDSTGLLRTLSVSGSFGMPPLGIPGDSIDGRQDDNEVIAGVEFDSLQGWPMGTKLTAIGSKLHTAHGVHLVAQHRQ